MHVFKPYSFALALSLFLLSFSTVRANVHFSDHFDDGDTGKWEELYHNCPLNDRWEFVDGKYGISISSSGCVTESVPNDENWNDDWNDYIFEVDMFPISGLDKNIAWRLSQWPNWVGIQFVDGSVNLQRAIQVSEVNKFPMQNLHEYHFRFEIIGDHFDIFYYDYANPEHVAHIVAIPKDEYRGFGKPALQASKGGGGVNEVYFDNFVVRGVNKTLDMPLYLQTNQDWADEIYDHASGWYPDDYFKTWGCALTSGAMVLNYHGVNVFKGADDPNNSHTPDGTPLHPGSLNNWLIHQPDGFSRNGSVSWNALSRLSRLIHEEIDDSPKLEWRRVETNDFKDVNDVAAINQPDILALSVPESPSGTHFVVATGVESSGSSYFVNDPYFDKETVQATSSGLLGIRRFNKTNSDFSYLLAHTDDSVDTVVESTQGRVGVLEGNKYSDLDESWYSHELPLNGYGDGVVGLSGDPFHEIGIPTPETGEYKLRFVSDSYTGWVYFEIYGYDQDANPTIIKDRVFVYAGSDTELLFSYSPESNIDDSSLNYNYSFDDLIALINWLESEGEIYSHGQAERLRSQVINAGRFYPLVKRLSAKFFDQFQKELNQELGKHMSQSAYDQINDLLIIVLGNLGL